MFTFVVPAIQVRDSVSVRQYPATRLGQLLVAVEVGVLVAVAVGVRVYVGVGVLVDVAVGVDVKVALGV